MQAKRKKVAMGMLLLLLFIVDKKDEKFNEDVCRFAFNRCGFGILIYLLHTPPYADAFTYFYRSRYEWLHYLILF